MTEIFFLLLLLPSKPWNDALHELEEGSSKWLTDWTNKDDEREDLLGFSLSMMIILTLFLADVMMMGRLLLHIPTLSFSACVSSDWSVSCFWNGDDDGMASGYLLAFLPECCGSL
jgi:hypothetical protein